MDRLISTEYLKKYIRENGIYCDTDADKEFSCKVIDSMPTVDAIPVEYILKRMDEMNDFITEWGGVAEKENLVDSYVHDVCALARLVYGWRKDNGQTD